MKQNKGLMTEGVIWKQLLLFALPLLLGNLFQQFYNTVDSIVVGNYIGPNALAAVGASTPIVNLMVGLFTGKIRQNRGMLFHGNILAHQPILVDPQIRGKEMRDIGTGNGFATDVLAHMAFAELDIELFRSMNEINLFKLA